MVVFSCSSEDRSAHSTILIFTVRAFGKFLSSDVVVLTLPPFPFVALGLTSTAPRESPARLIRKLPVINVPKACSAPHAESTSRELMVLGALPIYGCRARWCDVWTCVSDPVYATSPAP